MVPGRQRHYEAFGEGRIDLEPILNWGSAFRLEMGFDHFLGFFGIFQGNAISLFDEIAGDIDLAAVDMDMAMADDLAGLSSGRGKIHFVEHIVQTSFQEGEQDFAGIAANAFGLVEIVTELFFEYAIKAFYFLLFA